MHQTFRAGTDRNIHDTSLGTHGHGLEVKKIRLLLTISTVVRVESEVELPSKHCTVVCMDEFEYTLVDHIRL